MSGHFLNIKTPVHERTVHIVTTPITIGRGEGNTVVITDSSASRFHCVIQKTMEGYRIRDLGSRNGTLLNETRITNSILQPGEVVSIGQTQITLWLTQADADAKKSGNTTGSALTRLANLHELEVLDELEILEEVEKLDELETIEEKIATDAATAGAVLRQMADDMPDKPFRVDAITLVNTRGQPTHTGGEDESAANEVVTLVRLALLVCFRCRATDIHLEPRADDFLLRIRVDGTLLEIVAIGKAIGTRFIALIKILCDLDTTQRFTVQEGHFSSRVPVNASSRSNEERRVDYRISFVPTLYGQKMVIRVFDANNAPLLLEELQLPAWMVKEIQNELSLSTGIILVCGPTGSGKTTTLYSLVRSCGVTNRNVVTIEDPIEVQIQGTTQLPVDDPAGKTFSALLRSVLRQDPDVIMVGEIRDSETGRIALQAASTGHLVFSTIHTRDTVGTIFRLLDLGVEPYMIAQGLHLILSQRLARKLCTYCRKAIEITPAQRARMGSAANGVRYIFQPVGCPRCLGTGHFGRRAFFELLKVSDEIRGCISGNPNVGSIQKLLVGTKFVTLQQAGFELVASGETTFDEIDRTTTM